MFYTDNKYYLELIESLKIALLPKDNLQQIASIRKILLAKSAILSQQTFDLNLGDKKMKKIPIYSGDNFNVQLFVWKDGVRSVKHSHQGNWGNILVLEGIITVREYDLKEVDWDKLNFKTIKKTQSDYRAGEVFSLLQNYNALHSMSNMTQGLTVTLHVYQKTQEDYYIVKKGILLGK